MHKRLAAPAALAVAVGAILCAGPGQAQTTGGLVGVILDSTNQAPVPDAVVIATSPALQGEQTAVTDASGGFEISLLPAGAYALNVQRDGYEASTVRGLTVRLDRTVKLTLQLNPAVLKGGEIVVESARPVIATQSTTQGSVIDARQMELINYGRNGRGFEQVATAVPGVHPDLFGFSVNGSGSPENQYIIDGVSVNDPAVGTQGTTLLQDFVQEVDIKTGGYQAEYGRATGGIINVVTKSGGNEFHGSVFANYSPFEASRKAVGNLGEAIGVQVKQNYNLDFGAELGGPILKDKLWFFAGFAPQIISKRVDRVIQAQQEDPNNPGSALRNPTTGGPQVAEVARKSYSATNTSYQFAGKLTYLLNENHNVALAVYGNPTRGTGAQGGILPGATLRGTEGTYLFDTGFGATDASLRYSGKLLNKSMLVEASGQYHHQSGGGAFPNVSYATVNGVSGATLRDTPAVSWRQVHNLLDPAFALDPTTPDYQSGAQVAAACAIRADGFDPCPVNRYNTGGIGFVSNNTLDRFGGTLKLSNFVELLGHHQFKYGVDASEDRYNQEKYYTGGGFWFARSTGGVVNRFQQVRGFGQPDPARPGQPLADAAGNPLGTTVNTATRNFTAALFAQDTWSILDKVVLDAGIRYELQRMYADPNTTDANGNKVSGAQIALNNVMPRVGLIYDPTGRGLSKVYASYGRFYEYVPLDLADRALSAETQATRTTNAQSCKNPGDPRTCALIPNGNPDGRTWDFIGGAAGTAVDPNLQGQYADEYQAGAQYQVYRDISIGVDYVRKQLGRVIEDMSADDGNTYFLSNPGEPGKLGYSATTGNGSTVIEPKPSRIYDGLTLSVNKSFSENYLVTASYTYSSFRGNYPGLFKSDTTQLDPNILSEYDLVSLLPNRQGPLPGDTPNSFKLDAAYVYEIDAKTTVNLGGNLRADQGSPVNYLGAHPTYGPGEAYILPRGSGGRLPWTWQLDLRAAGNRRLSRGYNLGVTVDLFNVTNNQETRTVDENYTFDSVSPIVNGKVADLAYFKNSAGAPVNVNTNFRNPTSYQLPFSARFGAKLSF